MFGPCSIMQYILISFAIISLLKIKRLLYVKCIPAVMWLLVVCFSSHGAVGWWAVYDNGHIHFWNVCGDTELTKVASGMRRDFYSVKLDHKETQHKGLKSIQKPHKM